MTIRDPRAYVDSLWDWGCLDGCFGNSKIKPTDLDGVVEHNGLFLVIETKGPGIEIPQGQAIMFDQLAAKPQMTILVIWGKPGIPEEAQIWTYPKHNANLASIRDCVKQWYEKAHSTKPELERVA